MSEQEKIQDLPFALWTKERISDCQRQLDEKMDRLGIVPGDLKALYQIGSDEAIGLLLNQILLWEDSSLAPIYFLHFIPVVFEHFSSFCQKSVGKKILEASDKAEMLEWTAVAGALEIMRGYFAELREQWFAQPTGVAQG